MRRIAFALVAGLAAQAATAQVRTPEFTRAEFVFNEEHNLRSRVIAQVLLIATGHQTSVPTENLGLRTFEAIKRFQEQNGIWPDGVLNKSTHDRLFATAAPMMTMWDFKLLEHPSRGRPIWVPQGLSLRPLTNKSGLAFEDSLARLIVKYNYFPSINVALVYSDTLERKRRNRYTINYSVIKDEWFVISATSSSGKDEYLRYHQDGDGVLGFSLFWDNAKGNVGGERIAILMSASLGSVMNGRPMVEPPGASQAAARVAATPPLQVPVPAQPVARENAPVPSALPPVATAPPAPAPPAAPKAEENGISTGSGFFVDTNGNFITNAHVIKDCKFVVVKLNDSKSPHNARVAATDSSNDLALLAIEDAKGGRFAPIRTGTRLGESVAAFGYPHADILASSGNFTLGNITALSGLGDDSRYYQISTPVQQGNSGGPLLDSYGNAVGVVAAKLNVLKVALASGDFPQNINFAIKSTMLATFLESNQIAIQPGTTTGAKLDPADLADSAKAMSGFVACQ
ncbi:Peptidoglycan-binding domain 1 protein [Methylobacterium sp. 4-46]|uniref:serine protease n=1 Tax=unclassified Methylobacterium TaxID=2615210 RepID=UPI000165CCCB|nr:MULTISPECIES: serine protease [Methylobacterium]ACA20681.1 Peptidoglycan-binding domain 1 protein [Methylobacterium sp. 4-46]WFT79840.1 serine protease [Methylobacterium nodulans]